MNRITWVTIIFSFSLIGCKEKLNLQAPYKDITVVYGLLDQNDSIHYVRINKAYAGNLSAYASAQQFDSIYYPVSQLSVELDDYNGNGVLLKKFLLDTTTSVAMSPGIFSYPKEILYYFKGKLNTNDNYMLSVTNEKTGTVTTGSASLLTDVLVSGLQSNSLPFSWLSFSPNTISWSAVPNSYIYQLIVAFTYVEYNKSSGDSTINTINWTFAPMEPDKNGSISYEYIGSDFMYFLLNTIGVNHNVTRKARDTVNVQVISGSYDFDTYWITHLTNYTANQDHLQYSDVKNGLGLFTSRHIQQFKKTLDAGTIDSIINGQITAPLGFTP